MARSLADRATRREQKRRGYTQKEIDKKRRIPQAKGPVGAKGAMGPKAQKKPRPISKYERAGKPSPKQAAKKAKGSQLGPLKTAKRGLDLLNSVNPFSLHNVERVGEAAVKGAVKGVKAAKEDKGHKELRDKPVKTGGGIDDAVVGAFKGAKKGVSSITKDAVRTIDVTARPSYAISAGTKAAIKGKSVSKGAAEGLKGKDRGGFSEVLKAAGVKNKYVQHGAGFLLDVGTDPTSYATFGTSGAAHAAATQASRKALKKGATAAGAKAAGEAAAKGLPKNKGIQVGARVHVPFTNKTFEKHTTGKTTAKISKKTGVSKASTKGRESKVGQGVGESLLHDFRPKGVGRAEHAAVRASNRRTRAAITQATRATERKAKGLTKASKGKHDEVVKELESGAPTSKVAKNVAADFRKSLEAERKAGIRETAIDDGYFPHFQNRLVDKKAAKVAKKANLPSRIKPEKAHQRKIQGTLDEANKEMGVLPDSPLAFSKDVPKVYARKLEQSAKNVALANHWKSVVRTGRKVTKDAPVELRENEAIYRITARGPELAARNVDEDKKLIARIAGGKHPEYGRDLTDDELSKTQYVVLNEKAVDEAKRATQGAAAPSNNPIGRGYDRLQGAWKLGVTQPMPSYHIRNLIGDSLNAFLADTTVRSGKKAAGVLKARHAKNAAEAGTEAFAGKRISPASLNKTVTIGKQKVTYGKLIDDAEREGVIGTGFAGKDVNSLLELDQASTKLGKAARSLSAASQYREDLPRLATYISARQRGMTSTDAAEWAMKHHFDYGDLTDFERGARRVIPFWTFYARNSRLQATKVLERPGKYATFAKVLNDSAKAAGYEDYETYANQHQDYQKRGLPIPIKIGGKTYDAIVGAPATDLASLSVDPARQAQNIANRITFYKLIPEIYANYSVFFQGDIRKGYAPTVRAPELVADLPEGVKKKLGVQKYLDKKSGKMVWGWDAKVDYIARQMPETNFAIQQLTKGEGSRGQDNKLSRIAVATGVKLTPFDPTKKKLADAYDELQKVNDKMAAMSGQYKTKGTPAYVKLKLRKKELERTINGLQTASGVAVPSYKRSGASGPPGSKIAPPGAGKLAAPSSYIAPPK